MVASFIEAVHRGGAFLWPILVFAIFALGIATERIVYVVFRASSNATAFMAHVQKFILSNQIDRAIQLCSAEPDAALARVVKAGLLRASSTEVEIGNAVEETVLEVFPDLQRRTGYLPMLANVATLTGLLGTIQGLIVAFDAVANAPPEAKQTLLAQGIAASMYPTFAGLVVAIPTLVLHGAIHGRTVKLMDDVDQYALKTVNLLGARRRGTLGPERAEGARVSGADDGE